MAINKVEKTSNSPVKISYTDKDYTNILDDLIESISGITAKWDTTDVNDPGMVMVKLMAILGDMLFYSQDMTSLEVYPNSVTQRKNAQAIYKLIGYKMRWYKSATLQCNVVNTYTSAATMPYFCTFSNDSGDIVYTTFKQYELKSNTNNNGLETLIELVQGTPVTPVRISNNPYPNTGKAWHTIYGYNYTTDDIINNRIYLSHKNIDQDHIIVIDNTGEEWTLKDNIYITMDVGRFFEFGVDVNDQPYIELVDYYNNYNVSKFKIFYIRSNGETGQIRGNTLTNVTGSVWSRVGVGDEQTVYNVSSFIKFTHYDSSYGYDPETPDEARKNSVVFQNTLDTLITLADFERATLRETGVANVRACDLTNDPGIKTTKYLGDLNEDGIIDEEDFNILSNYVADPIGHPLTTYQRKLADLDQDGDTINSKDLACLDAYLHPVLWQVGDINQDGQITQADLTLLKTYITNPKSSKLTDFQIRLADINQDGIVDEKDVTELQKYFNTTNHPGFGTIYDQSLSKYTGLQTVSTVKTLDGFVVKLYILKEPEYESFDDESFQNMIISDLGDYKILPLTIEVDTTSIHKYYWSIKGKFYTRSPLSRDELQTIIVNINNQLRYDYAIDKINFNTVIEYKKIIETILNVDSRILMVDLDPITYVDDEGTEISKEQLTGAYTQTIPMKTEGDDASKLHYSIILENTTVLPGSVMIRVNGGQYTLRDNNNGEIFNVNNVLQHKGSINYLTGEIDLEFTEPIHDDLKIDYMHNITTVAVYRNLSTQEFYFDSSSLKSDETQDIV